MSTTDETISKVADAAAGDISFFLGAGASAAAGLPTMVSFLDKAYGDGFVSKLEQGIPYNVATTDTRLIAQNEAATTLRLFQTIGLITGKPAFDLEAIFEFIHKSAVMSTSPEIIKSLLWMFKVCQESSNWDFKTYREQFNHNAPRIKRGWRIFVVALQTFVKKCTSHF